uniref:Uncharacterized protein n=1 Tax=Anguilla anguilla TaxID=7936 RepID=A0A0E9U3I8_ANGAN
MFCINDMRVDDSR